MEEVKNIVDREVLTMKQITEKYPNRWVGVLFDKTYTDNDDKWKGRVVVTINSPSDDDNACLYLAQLKYNDYIDYLFHTTPDSNGDYIICMKGGFNNVG